MLEVHSSYGSSLLQLLYSLRQISAFFRFKFRIVIYLPGCRPRFKNHQRVKSQTATTNIYNILAHPSLLYLIHTHQAPPVGDLFFFLTPLSVTKNDRGMGRADSRSRLKLQAQNSVN